MTASTPYQQTAVWPNPSTATSDQHPIEDPYNTHDASFRRHYQLNYHDNEHDYEAFYAPAYRFGFQLGEENPSVPWEMVKAGAQRHWQTNHPSAWGEVATAVQYGWKEQRDPEALRVHHYDAFETYRAGFLRHHETVPDRAGLPFAHYEPAYQYGYTLAVDPAYHAQRWSEVEPEVRTYYETEYADSQLPWERYRDAVQYAWHDVRATTI